MAYAYAGWLVVRCAATVGNHSTLAMAALLVLTLRRI